MVLELLVNPKKVTGRPWEMLFIGAVYSFVAAFLALWIFKNYVSIVMVTLTIIASIPLVSSIIKQEENRDRVVRQEKRLLKEHSQAIKALVYLFLGFTLSFTLLYIFLPSAIVERMFNAQLETIITVQSAPTGDFIGSFRIFNGILMNNLKILLFCIAFSFFYGAGAIFILTWNASVMAAAIGAVIRPGLAAATGITSYISLTSLGVLKYAIHGIPEIIAYFIGGLASGIISFALLKHDIKSNNFKHILRDVIDLVLIAIAILFAAALIEIFVSPLL